MLFYCKKCNNDIKKLNFQEEFHLEIWAMLRQGLKLFAIQRLVDEYKLSHKEAKTVIAHYNDYGKCHRCNYNHLDKEYINCPQCNAFNYNLKPKTSFNTEFCTYLSFKLNFDDLGIDEIKAYWCDGIDSIPRNIIDLSKSNILKNKSIITKAWIGKSGQDEYEMEILLGDESIILYEQNESLIPCIPTSDFKDWINIDTSRKHIQIQLK